MVLGGLILLQGCGVRTPTPEEYARAHLAVLKRTPMFGPPISRDVLSEALKETGLSYDKYIAGQRKAEEDVKYSLAVMREIMRISTNTHD